MALLKAVCLDAPLPMTAACHVIGAWGLVQLGFDESAVEIITSLNLLLSLQRLSHNNKVFMHVPWVCVHDSLTIVYLIK